MPARLANLGYFAYAKEATKGTPLTPTTFLPLYNETMSTNQNFIQQKPIYGGKFATYVNLQGQRDHTGELTTIAEANSTPQLLNALLTKGTTTGAGPYSTPFTLSSTDPISLTADFSTGNIVRRFFGLQFSSITPAWNDNELQHKLKASALGSFEGRTIASISTTTLTLDTKYDQAPTKGLVVGDLVRIYKASDGSTLDTTIATVNADGITITLAVSAAAFAAGDIIHLRPATPSFTLTDTFLWAKTQFLFGATAAAALAATQTRVEQGSTYELIHSFEDDAGAKPSGGFDPARLTRTTGDYSLSVKKFFDTPEDIQKFQDGTKGAVVIRHFAGSSNQYEYRITFNSVTTDTPSTNISSGDVNYATITYLPNYGVTDGQGFSVLTNHAIATI
jgi:hypothetical protein